MKRGWLTACVLGIVLAVFSPAWAVADAAHPEKKDTDGKADPHKKEETNFFKGVIDLAIWTIAVFLILLFVLSKFAWPMMLEGLEKRERAVTSALEQAQSAQSEAERIKAELELRFKQANDEIRALMEQSRQQAQHNAEGLLNKARAEIQADREQLNRDIDAKAEQTLRDLRGRVTSLAAAISSKVIGRAVREEDLRGLVETA